MEDGGREGGRESREREGEGERGREANIIDRVMLALSSGELLTH